MARGVSLLQMHRVNVRVTAAIEGEPQGTKEGMSAPAISSLEVPL